MAYLIDAFQTALHLIATLDPDLVEILVLSLKVSLTAVAIASVLGFAIGGVLAVYRFPGRGGLSAVLSALMGLPPVVAGLIVYLLLSNSGPLGVLQLLYTPTAMIIAQVVLVTPIIGALTQQACRDLLVEYDEQLRSLGASSRAIVLTLLWDGRFRLITAVLVLKSSPKVFTAWLDLYLATSECSIYRTDDSRAVGIPISFMCAYASNLILQNLQHVKHPTTVVVRMQRLMLYCCRSHPFIPGGPLKYIGVHLREPKNM